MPVFTLPEMKNFKRQMVEDMIQEIKNQMELDKQKWETMKKLIVDFDVNLETLENYQKSREFRGTKSPRKLCERMRYSTVAESFLRTQLRLVLIDNLTKGDREDTRKLATMQYHELLALDDHRTRVLRTRFQKLTNFKKLGDNQYQVLFQLKCNKQHLLFFKNVKK